MLLTTWPGRGLLYLVVLGCYHLICTPTIVSGVRLVEIGEAAVDDFKRLIDAVEKCMNDWAEEKLKSPTRDPDESDPRDPFKEHREELAPLVRALQRAILENEWKQKTTSPEAIEELLQLIQHIENGKILETFIQVQWKGEIKRISAEGAEGEGEKLVPLEWEKDGAPAGGESSIKLCAIHNSRDGRSTCYEVEAHVEVGNPHESNGVVLFRTTPMSAREYKHLLGNSRGETLQAVLKKEGGIPPPYEFPPYESIAIRPSSIPEHLWALVPLPLRPTVSQAELLIDGGGGKVTLRYTHDHLVFVAPPASEQTWRELTRREARAICKAEGKDAGLCEIM